MRPYARPEFAAALAEWGRPRELPAAGGWLLERPTPTGGLCDAMGPYPLFACTDWSRLESDLERLDDLVSVTLVADPFGPRDPELLHATFDHVAPFKEHVVVDLERPVAGVSRHHRRYAKVALRRLTVERAADPVAHAGDWARLYAHLAERHGLQGIKRFSAASFAQQLAVPGTVLYVARHEDRIVGAQIWYVDPEVGFNHLQATSLEGYELRAAFALHWTALHELGEETALLDLGGAAGASDAATGLLSFKRGWANRPPLRTHLCGKVLRPAEYADLAGAAPASASGWFPAYRAQELA